MRRGWLTWSLPLLAATFLSRHDTPPSAAQQPRQPSPRERATLHGHKSYVSALALSPDGKALASGSHDHTLKLWDPARDWLRGTLRGHAGYVYAAAFNTTG